MFKGSPPNSQLEMTRGALTTHQQTIRTFKPPNSSMLSGLKDESLFMSIQSETLSH